MINHKEFSFPFDFIFDLSSTPCFLLIFSIEMTGNQNNQRKREGYSKSLLLSEQDNDAKIEELHGKVATLKNVCEYSNILDYHRNRK